MTEDRLPRVPQPRPSPICYPREERRQLQTARAEIQQQIARLEPDQVLEITQHLEDGSYAYGTAVQPRVTQIQADPSSLRMGNNAQVTGAGVLIIPRVVLLNNVTFSGRA